MKIEGLKEFADKSNASYQVFDKCHIAALKLMFYKRYQNIDNFEFVCNSENNEFDIIDKDTNSSNLLQVGRRAILYVKQIANNLIEISKINNDDFETLCSYAANNERDDFKKLLKTASTHINHADDDYRTEAYGNDRIIDGEADFWRAVDSGRLDDIGL